MNQMIRQLYIISPAYYLCMVFLATGCMSENTHIHSAYLIGEWKTDSIMTYYNGFETREKASPFESIFTYKTNQIVRESRGTDFREFQYDFIAPDSLAYISPEGKLLGTYQILELKPEKLVLKKEKGVLFPGKGQERYEVRIFSKQSESH